VERSDGRLATVSYLFGVPDEVQDADQAVQAEAAHDEVARAEAALSEAAALAAEAHRAVLQAAAVAAAQALDAARAEAAAAVRAAEQLPSERSRTTPRLRAVARDAGPGWYVDPEAELANEADDETPAAGLAAEPGVESGFQAEPDAERSLRTEPGVGPGLRAESDAGREAPAGAVAAARAFLSTVEPRGSESVPAAPGSSVRFVAEDDDDESDPDSADATGRKKPPPVRQASINALARKGMSSAEMTDLLEAREVDPDEVVLEVARLEAAGLLDDRVLAEHLVRTLQERKGLGRSAINAELRRRKVDQAAIDEALDTVDVDDELERCLEVAVKRASQLRSYDRATAERRLSAFLMRRGYAGSVISAAVAQALGPVGPRFR